MRKKADDWVARLPGKPKETATPEDWFAVTAASDPPAVCKTLGGPWAEGLDPDRAALTRHETLKVESETVLLEGDKLPLAIEWTVVNGGTVLVVANGAFLLNAALLNPARRPLAERVVAVGGRVAAAGGVRRGWPGAWRPAGPAFGLRSAQGAAIRLGGGADAGIGAGRLPGAAPRGWADPAPSPPPTPTAPPLTPRRWAPSWHGLDRPPTPAPSSTPIAAGDIPRPSAVRPPPRAIDHP